MKLFLQTSMLSIGSLIGVVMLATPVNAAPAHEPHSFAVKKHKHEIYHGAKVKHTSAKPGSHVMDGPGGDDSSGSSSGGTEPAPSSSGGTSNPSSSGSSSSTHMPNDNPNLKNGAATKAIGPKAEDPMNKGIIFQKSGGQHQ